MVELDQFKYTLSTYEKPLQEVRESLNLDAKIRRIDELDKTMEEPSFWEDAELSTRLVKEEMCIRDSGVAVPGNSPGGKYRHRSMGCGHRK